MWHKMLSSRRKSEKRKGTTSPFSSSICKGLVKGVKQSLQIAVFGDWSSWNEFQCPECPEDLDPTISTLKFATDFPAWV